MFSDEDFTVTYFLNESSKENLYCLLSDGIDSTEFSLKYYISPDQWDKEYSKCPWDDPYYFTLESLTEFLVKRYTENDFDNDISNVAKLKLKIENILCDNIENLAIYFFDLENAQHGIHSYDIFIEAFEKHSGLKKDSYHAKVVGYCIYFKTETGNFFMDTYEGRTTLLKAFIERKSYDEIYTETCLAIWNEIYVDGGIGKDKFVPRMLREWELYWDDLYDRINKRTGNTNHLNKSKEQSWRQFQLLSESYNDAVDIIRLAYEFDEYILYPIAVISMMHIFNTEVCYQEYCELEFDAHYENEWDSICLNEDDEGNIEGPILYIMEAEY